MTALGLGLAWLAAGVDIALLVGAVRHGGCCDPERRGRRINDQHDPSEQV